eukprot:3431652-Amphidinium_carterae.2
MVQSLQRRQKAASAKSCQHTTADNAVAAGADRLQRQTPTSAQSPAAWIWGSLHCAKQRGTLKASQAAQKQTAPKTHEQLVECWKPKLLAGPTILVKVRAANAKQVAAQLTNAGFRVTPSKTFQEATKVAWSKAETLEGKEASEGSLKRCARQASVGRQHPMNEGSGAVHLK